MSGEAERVLENNVQRLRKLITNYNLTRSSSQRLELQGPFDLGALSTTEITRRPGVYLIFCEDGSFKYTGKSEKSTTRSRIGNHLKPKVQASPFWRNSPPPKFFCVIETPGEEAGALETYLQRNDFYGR